MLSWTCEVRMIQIVILDTIFTFGVPVNCYTNKPTKCDIFGWEAIKTEKRLELCWECVRFQDLVRWGDAYEALKDQGKQVPTVGSNGVVEWRDTGVDGGFKKGKHELLPFPSSEIRVNKNIKQNPNW